MQSQKFLANYKCECYGHDYCNCPQRDANNAIFLENVYDVADALAEIMIVCGIHPCKTKASIDVIIYSFLHYDEIRHRIDAVPRKRLCKEDLIHDLGRKCLMNRMEAQLTYSIIKRAFKAFYHGTTEGGIRSPELEAQLIHSQECMWVHAAKRTAQVFANYEGMFFSAQKHYESQIKCVYKRLYDRLQHRANPVDASSCFCKGCLKKVVVGNIKCLKKESDLSKQQSTEQDESSSQNVLPFENCQLHPKPYCELAPSPKGQNGHNEPNGHNGPNGPNGQNGPNAKADMEETANSKVTLTGHSESKLSINLSQCYKCNCPKLICDCDVDRDTGVVSTDCSQGPYKCTWIRIGDDEPADTCIEIPEDHQCPVDCDEESISCNPKCDCNCIDNCECAIEDNSSDYEIGDELASLDIKGEEEENAIELQSSERSGYGGCCVINHIVEEMTMSNNPTSIANVVGHKREASFKSEQIQSPKQANIGSIAGYRQLKPQTDEEKRKENEEIMKLIGQLI